MRRLARFALVALLAAPAAGQRSLAIERFDATISVERDASIQVTETITARFTGSWNGIYRAIPFKYRTPQGFNWTLGLHLIGATDASSGQALRVETERERHYVKYKIWVPGAQDATHTIVLRYRATNGLRFFEEHDELYWNVTGDEWDVPIDAATAVVQLPSEAGGVRAVAFNGPYGSTAQDATVDIQGTSIRVAMEGGLGFREGLTVVIGWNKGVVTEPTQTDRAVGFLSSNWPLAIPIPVFVILFAIWRRHGKDPRRRPIAVQYEPPAELTPAETGTLLDHSVDMRDVTATLVDLAVRGYIKIEEREEKKLFGLISNRDYILHRLGGHHEGKELAIHERRMLDGLFKTHGTTVQLSDLENEFYSALPGIRTGVFDRLLAKGFYRARPDRVRAGWTIGGVIAAAFLGIGGAAVVAPRFLLAPLSFVAAGLGVGVLALVFGSIMPARTVAGTRALEQVLGFEEFLRRVESDHLKRVIIEQPELFDRYLPFAMAFGVENKWVKAFEGIYTEPPNWYVGSSGGHFSPSRFSASLGQLSNAASSSLSSSPRSSGGSGFSGGSSGGGGGGGGGGGF